MAKVAKVIGMVAGVVAILATGGAALAPALGLSTATAATLTTIAGISSLPAGQESIGIQLRTAWPGDPP